MSMTWENAKKAAAEMAEGVELGSKTQEAVGSFLLRMMEYQSRDSEEGLKKRITKLFEPTLCTDSYWLALIAREIFMEKMTSEASVGSKEHFDDFEAATKKDPFFRGCRTNASWYRMWLEDSLADAPKYLLKRMQEQIDDRTKAARKMEETLGECPSWC